MEVNPIVIMGALTYFAVLFWIGWSSRKASSDASEFYVAGRKIGPFVNGSALAATYFSPASFLGLPAFIFILGYPFWWALVGIIGGMPIATLLTAAPLRKYAPTSFTDYYADRYETKWMRLIAGIPTIIGGFAYVILSIVSTALFMMAILRLDFALSVVLAAVVVYAYIYLGGMVATTISTAFQGIMMTMASLLATAYVISNYGGLNGLTDAVLANSPHFFNMPYVTETPSHKLMSMWTGVVGFFFTWHFGFSAMPYTVVRFFTTQDINAARRSVFWAVILGGAMYAGLIIIGTGARVLIETMHPLMQTEGISSAIDVLKHMKTAFGVAGATVTDYSMIAAMESLKSPFLLAIITAGGLAMAMATAAGWTMVLNVLLGRDLLGKVFGNKWPEEKPVQCARVMTTIVIFVCMLFAFKPPALVLDISGAAFVVILCSCGPPLILGIWWTRATTAAAATNVLVMTFLSCFSWMYANSVHKTAHVFFLDKTIVTPHQFYWVFVGFIFFILVSLITKPNSDKAIQKYSLDLRPEE
ncbi:sodium:solute symporter family protein [Desulfonema magnum]|uniref:Sodium/solute symporter domain-containing protein n=1 Tax=Desulfonema magnum TaxID=45655 RepID=A0A975GQV4_9BACT|nr:cation acetate symporter [Desulfonema magnum]QTA90299.1 Sodium/solute symporter domain-containing protein [Desulfonema magnum]